MFEWLYEFGEELRHPQPGRPQYVRSFLGKGPVFPQNPDFKSQRVLSEATRELVWSRIVEKGETLKAVSADMSIDTRRIAAVVRLMEIEKRWITEGKKLARPYARAIMGMLPQTEFKPGQPGEHEPITEMHIHSRTTQQLFVPVPESRRFTRADAAHAFADWMRPPEERLPIPELVQLERDRAGGSSRDGALQRFRQAVDESEKVAVEAARRRVQRREAKTTHVDAGRFSFRFENVNVDHAGKDGRSPKATGWRYGVPLGDRRRGRVTIPTKMD